MGPKVDCLIVDTTAFIKNAPLHEISSEITTVQEVVNEITSKRQIRRLVVLPYDLVLKEVFPENVQFITDFSKKTGDYPSLSSTDIKVMALTYQLEKEKVGTSHLNTTPTVKKEITFNHHLSKDMKETAGFFFPSAKDNEDEEKDDEEEEEEEDDINESEVKEITEKLSTVDCAENGENKFNYSLPTPQGGKHAKNPILCEDQRLPDQRPTRLAKTKTNPLDPDYIAGYSPFVMRDINSRSAMLGIRGNMDMKSLMRKEPNNAKRKGKKKK
ncbi:hypothetical protein C0J52_00534 [Blattella germanica]|nr:hypothetical protein C0J52_00534 [Blattella germanica]